MTLDEEYTAKLMLIMEQYIKGDLDSVEYQIELERLEDWYDSQLGENNVGG